MELVRLDAERARVVDELYAREGGTAPRGQMSFYVEHEGVCHGFAAVTISGPVVLIDGLVSATGTAAPCRFVLAMCEQIAVVTGAQVLIARSPLAADEHMEDFGFVQFGSELWSYSVGEAWSEEDDEEEEPPPPPPPPKKHKKKKRKK